MFMSVQPYFMGWRRENVQQSLQYTTTQVQQLVNFKTAYEALEVKVVEADDNSVLVQAYRNQQVAIIGQMRSIAALIPAGEVPASIQVLINRG
jgi:outer membrane protein assembly factor BamD (BamD/ComL family)